MRVRVDTLPLFESVAVKVKVCIWPVPPLGGELQELVLMFELERLLM